MAASDSASSEDSQHAKRSTRGGGWWRLAILGVVLLALFLASRVFPLVEYVEGFLEWVQSLGVWGPVVLALVYIIATVCMAPGSILSLGAGFAFGLVKGLLAVMAGSVLGALAAFLVGRTFARGFVEEKAKHYPRFAAIDRAVQHEGFKIVLLTRLSPIFPFNLLNYLLSITNVRLRDYFFATWLGMLPGMVLYVYLGAAAQDLTEILTGNAERGPWQYASLGVGLMATIAVTYYVTHIARRALKENVDQQEQTGE